LLLQYTAGMQEDLFALLGAPLRDLRTRAGMSQAELGRRVGVSGGAVGQFERGDKAPRLATALRLLRELVEVVTK